MCIVILLLICLQLKVVIHYNIVISHPHIKNKDMLK